MSDNVVPILYTYKYMWKTNDDSEGERFFLKIVTDVLEGLSLFEAELLKLCSDGKVSVLGKEYINQIDVSKIGFFETLYKSDKEDS